MPISKEVKSEVEKQLTDAITAYFAATMGVAPETLKEFHLEQGYPRVEYERGIYSDKIRIELSMERQPV